MTSKIQAKVATNHLTFLRFHSFQGKKATTREELRQKEEKKDEMNKGLRKRALASGQRKRVSIDSRFKAILIISQRKTICRQRPPEPSCARKETADIDILKTSSNGVRKIMQPIRITSGPATRMRKVNQPVQPV